MAIFLSCGHTDSKRPNGVPIRYKEYARDGSKCISYPSVCLDCYIRELEYYRDNDEDTRLILEDWEEQEWLTDE